MKIVFICSTNGSVIKQALSTGFLSACDIEFVSDRDCGIVSFAKESGYKYSILSAHSGAEFSKLLSDRYNENKEILFISFYTRLLTDPFVLNNLGRIINFHPSILPACPGMDGFHDTLKSGSMFVGSTVHFIDNGMDTGKPILQAACPRDPYIDTTQLRHRVFLQQVISLVQVADWFLSGNVVLGGQFKVLNASYNVGEFSPNLEPKYRSVFDDWIGQE
ncbi:formyltransferase family protein [Shewanella algae]|uniref:formyltransferase family protein n=1 Tax=Shewanella algae TaxID=38313 RepID=UPI0011844E7D|nr:formyltransferase family protein [Shewanella algae]TVP08405.1 hypothetical protein AYI73_00640 [Shewanella algae]BCV40206.1 phosphoribosylglycinamide formyltransferase [Shewanella algae]